MATAPAALLSKVEAIERGVYAQEWTATVSGPGNPIHSGRFESLSFQLHGPTGGTSAIILEGTNGGTVSTATWTTLNTPTVGALSITDVAGGMIVEPMERPRMIRPRFSPVTAGKTLTVKMIARGPLS